ncbi:hypothetical protein H5410_057140 [Solanum commersonii]|uniref:Uncharacterized protein n=1 Tax=Solanum commersonii TaxID=4109 RepID=A0A9J5WQ17_SOLCO|nr:hypothetical protein H5410_057140 [Solanum commersonii]
MQGTGGKKNRTYDFLNLEVAKGTYHVPCNPRLRVEGVDPVRREKLIQLLDIDLQWRMHKNCQNFGEKTDDAFRAVFGMEQPDRLRCYCRSVTTSSLKKDEETNKLKQKHDSVLQKCIDYIIAGFLSTMVHQMTLHFAFLVAA